MKKIKNYGLETADGPTALMERVQRMIREGWEPLGGVAFTRKDDGRGYTYAQAVVKVIDAS